MSTWKMVGNTVDSLGDSINPISQRAATHAIKNGDVNITGGTIQLSYFDADVKGDGFYNISGEHVLNQAYQYIYIDVKKYHNANEFRFKSSCDGFLINAIRQDGSFIKNMFNWGSVLDFNCNIANIAEIAYFCISAKKIEMPLLSVKIDCMGITYQLTKNINTIVGGEVKVYANDSVKTENGWCDHSGKFTSLNSHRHKLFDVRKNIDAKEVVIDTKTSNGFVINLLDKNQKVITSFGDWKQFSNRLVKLSKEVYYVSVSASIVDFESFSMIIKSQGSVSEINNKLDMVESCFNRATKTVTLQEDVLYKGWYDENGKFYGSDRHESKLIDLHLVSEIIINGVGAIVASICDENLHVIKHITKWGNASFLGFSNVKGGAYLQLSADKGDLSKTSIKLIYGSIKEQNNNNEIYRYDAAYIRMLSDNMPFIKGVHLDCGRKYFSLVNIKKLIDNMALAKLTHFQVYFSDHNGFRFGLDDMIVNFKGGTFDLSPALGEGTNGDGSNKWLTEAEMTEIITYANSKGIDVIPAFDMPGHMGAINSHLPSGLQGITNELAIDFKLSLLQKYIDYFKSHGCTCFNICGDESGLNIDILVPFLNRALHVIVQNDMVPLIYNDEICRNGVLDPYVNNGAIVLYWNNWRYSSSAIVDKGHYRQINSISSPLYWTLSKPSQGVAQEQIDAIKNMNFNQIHSGAVLKKVYGAMFHIWCDKADADGADDGTHVINVTAPLIEAMGVACAKIQA